jgi:hypothetical protein
MGQVLLDLIAGGTVKPNERALNEIRQVIREVAEALGSGDAANRRAAILACQTMRRWAPSVDVYASGYKRVYEKIENEPARALLEAIPLLQTLLTEVENGWLDSFEQQIRLEIESDLLAQAEQLLQGHHLRAATVLAGAALEQNIRSVASRAGIGTSHNFDRLLDDLVKAGKLTHPQRTQLRWCYSLRNAAAHGEAMSDDDGPIRLMLQSIRAVLAGLA